MIGISGFVNWISDNRKGHFIFFLAILLLLSAVMVFSYNLYPSFDFFFHFKRLNVLMEALKDGSFPIYIDHDAANGYGYITKWFYSDLILVPFAVLGLYTNAIFAYQFMWFSSTVATGLIMYWAVVRIYKNRFAASISSILYAFAFYRLLDMYTRSAVGEALSFTFVPIVFLGLYEIIWGDRRKWYILTIGYSLMIFTHVLSTFLMFITTLIVLGVSYKSFIKEPKRIYSLILAGLITLPIVAYFLFPMVEQMLSNSFYYQTIVKAHPDDHKQTFNWIIWGLFSGVVHPKQIFIPGIGILLTWAVSIRLFVSGDKSFNLKSVDYGVIIGFVMLLLASSLIPWTVFPFNKLLFIQLPWRFYEFVSFFFALAGGIYLSFILKSNKKRVLGMLLLTLCTMFVLSSSGKDFEYEGKKNRRSFDETATVNNNNYHLYGMEYIPSKVPSIKYIDGRGERIDTRNAETVLMNYHKDNMGITSFDIRLMKPDFVELPLFYYKGYKAVINGQEIPVSESKNGLMLLKIENGGKVYVWYDGTMIQKISPFISILSVVLLCIYILFTNRKKRIRDEFTC